MASDYHGTSAPTNTINHHDVSGRRGGHASKNGWSWAFICGFFSIIGAILLVTALLALISEVQLRRDCIEPTDGIVTQLILNPADESDDDSSDTWTPVFRYIVDGQSYEQKSSIASSPPRYKIGQAVAILYDPADPSRYVVKGDNSALVLYGSATIMCIGFTAVLPVAVVIHKINNPNSKASQQLPY
ncbi:hypothetical protein BISA_0783 [Bifidobacterium saguini DSM 23967]|uniref:DUF3592 domain-containing protein n=2 Tax=Bifidobacterium saguini TaxID=762210 RepID=A0A087DA33_9BIFI|nr:DUF3592 domain-containing protein [Bifidobacterium saguini]KFI92383.1 hypothetical protein BISA_0783 [Bifidobacterium saguini DSM 23967]QTB91081.1 DUF3592 domain-containing protein [Bifidobacterium saguini]